MRNKLSADVVKNEVIVTTSRSGGAGGQHVNKVETKVTLRFNILTSQVLSDEQKVTLQSAYSSQLTNEGDLIVTCEEHRSQIKNKEIAFEKLEALLSRPFIKVKARKPTKPTKGSKTRRINKKKQLGEKKKWRQKPE